MLKSFAAIFTTLRTRRGKRNLRTLLRFLVVLVAMIAVYSVLFHVLMVREGQDHSWFTGLYWTLTVMSTLGFGDITFYSDLGRAFSVLVLVSGVLFLLVLLPFTFIEFFYGPWMQAQAAARAAAARAPVGLGLVMAAAGGQVDPDRVGAVPVATNKNTQLPDE